MKIKLILIIIFVTAFILRVQFLPKNVLTFGYDQARDAIQVQNILEGDIKILGPSASTPGMHHGVFYYYFLTPAYFFGKGSPVAAAYWVAFFNSLVVFIVYLIAKILIGKPGAGVISAFLYAISFEASQYATWLSNPTIGAWTVPLMYLGLLFWTKERKLFIGPLLAALGLGLSIHANIFLLYQFPSQIP